MRVRAVVAYDGTCFAGFQRQVGVRSVQGELEAAFSRICNERVGVTGAGRTDAGVHAVGQVIAFETEWKRGVPAFERAANSVLPEDVAVSEVAVCGADFHPRFSAISRVYEYRVIAAPGRLPLHRRYVWQMDRHLDLNAMGEAAAMLVGEHDFAAFGSAPQGDVTVRRVMRADWDRDGTVFRFTIEANAFLYRMVRRVVMTLIRAGLGQLSADDVADILASQDAQRVKGAAPARGLCLVKVNYQGE